MMTSGLRSVFGEASAWLAIGASVLLSAVYYEDLKSAVSGTLIASIPEPAAVARNARPADPVALQGFKRVVRLNADRQGHFYTYAHINGRSAKVMVDTGATIVALTFEAARDIGLHLNASQFTHRMRTANGIARMAPVTLDAVRIGDISVSDVRGVVAERGRLHISLLGMSFLGKLSNVAISSGELILEE